MKNNIQQARKAVLGRIILDKSIPQNFDSSLFPEHQKIVVEILAGDFEPLSLIEKCGASYVTDLLIQSNEIFSIEAGMKILQRFDLRLKIKELAKEAVAEVENQNPNEILANLSLKALSLNKDHTKERSNAKEICDDFEDILLEYAQKSIDGQKTLGIPTDYPLIDDYLGGIRPGHLIAISAYTNVGKSTLMLNVVANILKKARVVIISLEMSKADMVAKLIAILNDMALSDVYSCGIDNQKYNDYKKAREIIETSKIAMYSEKHHLDEILAIMRAEEQREHVDLFCIDYIQNIVGRDNENEYQTMTRTTREIQDITAKLKTTTLVLSQISNENRKASELSINGKGSGAIRAASDMFLYLNYCIDDDEMLLQKLKNDEPIDMYVVANKNRHGKLGKMNIVRNSLSGKMYVA